MNLLYYPKDLVDKAVENCEVDDYESDVDLYDEDSKPNNFLHLFDKNVKNFLRFYLMLSVLPNQRIPISVDGNDEIHTLEDQITDKLQYKLDFFSGITNLIITNVKKLPPGKHKSEFSVGEHLPIEGLIKEAIHEGDVLTCDWESQEIWVKTLITIRCTDLFASTDSAGGEAPKR